MTSIYETVVTKAVTQSDSTKLVTVTESVKLVEQVGGPTSFTGLTDTPSTYSGQGLKWLRVNTGETAIEFVAVPVQKTIGIISPASPPSSVGEIYIDTVAGRAWLSMGTSSVADWREIFLGA